MDSVRGVTSLANDDGRHRCFRTLGPTLLISMAYVDLGKWVATVDAGARFGYDLVLLVLLFNCSAILCQYLSMCISMVTGKNLAEICHQEYSQAICAVLGLQARLSLIISEVTMVAGIAIGFNLVFEHDNVVAGICFASVAVILLPYIISCLDKRVAGTFNACIAGFALLCFVLGVLVSQPKIHVRMNVMFPKLRGESAYSLMALLGSNVIAHNFYVHSSVVQVQRRSPVLTLGSLFHDHLFSILFIFSGVFLMNYILVSSAADEVSNPMLMNSEDAVELMHQGILDPAFSKPRNPLRDCACLKEAGSVAKPIPGTFTTATMILELIKGVEQAVSSRKGRSGTAAGNIAFPKGKENLASVLKRYKRRLARKTPAAQ